MAYQVGDESYDEDEFGTPWWAERAGSAAHQRAYRSMARFAAEHCPKPKLIVDVACGTGLLIRELAKTFPKARIIGIDESRQGIEAAGKILNKAGIAVGKRIQLRCTPLPDFDLALAADLVTFTFPDFRGGMAKENIRHWRERFPDDWEAGRKLRRKWKKIADPDIGIAKKREVFFKRMASRNLHHFCKPGGRILRVEYANCTRKNMDEATLAEMQWIEGCCPEPEALRFTSLLDSRYRRSAVMMDVYLQTKDKGDKEGGYLMSMLQALPVPSSVRA